MKKTYLARRNALLTYQSISWGVFALFLVVLFLLLRVIAPNFFWKVFAPIYRATDSVAAVGHTVVGSFGNTAVLTEQNEKLLAENAALATENRMLWKRVEGLSPFDKDTSGVLAGIVARPPTSPYDTLVVATGKEGGVMLGMEAFAAGGVPIGSVTSVSADFSHITLFSAPGTRTDGWVGEEGVAIVLEGVGGGAVTASVSREAGITEGDVVFVPGPGMLPIGKVVKIESNPLLSHVVLQIMPATNIFSLAWVELRATGVMPATFVSSQP